MHAAVRAAPDTICDNPGMAPRSFDIARWRLHSQRLVSAPLRTPAEVVGWFGAIQAQEYAGAMWAVAQRTRGAVESDVEGAVRDGAIVRTHVMRQTWHFVLPCDVRWMLALTAPRTKQTMSYYDRQFGVDRRTIRRSHDAIIRALSGGRQLTRDELSAVLARIRIQAKGHRLGRLVMHAELDALICSGARRGKQFTYALLDERCPSTAAIDRDEALGELARRYFTAHGPALRTDFAWWSGLSMADARRAIAVAQPELSSHNHDDQAYWFVDTVAAPGNAPRVHLLPRFDEYLVAYRRRADVIDAAMGKHERIDLLATPIVIRDGKAIGSWRRGKPAPTTTLAAALTGPERRALDATIQRFIGFLPGRDGGPARQQQ